MHRASRSNRRPVAVVLSILATLALVVGAVSLSPARADSGLSPLELAQVQRANCQVLLAHAANSTQRTRANQCIADQTVIIKALTGSPTPTPSATQSPSPSPSPTVQPSPTVSPTATTPPATTPPATTPPPAGDTSPPSVPTGLTATAKSPTSLLITWAASSDNVGVTGYLFERGTTQLGITPTPDWLDTGLTADTAYTYRVRAQDAAGNLSAYSAVLSAQTPANPPPTPGNQCQANPEDCGFPGPNTTGATDSTTTLNGDQTFSTAGAVISNTRINGCVEVRAANVTFRNVFVNGPASCFWVVQNFSTGLQVIDSTITGNGGNGTCIGSSGLSLLRVELTGCENGLNVAGMTTVTDSWIHDLTTANGAHTDGAQFNQGASSILFAHNTIIMPTPGSTSAVIMWDEGDPQNSNVSLVNNLLAGGTYTVYCGRTGTVVNVQLVNNRFGDFEFGYANDCADGEDWSGNVDDATGAPLAAE